MALEVASNGYGGPIRILVGMAADGSVIDIAVISHNETPGLGKKIETAHFKDQFRNPTLKEMYLKKESPDGAIDAITAATISSRAVTDGVRKALESKRIAGF